MRNSWAFCFDKSYEWRWQVINPHAGVWLRSKQGHEDLDDCIKDATKFGFCGNPALFIDAGGKAIVSSD
jgi:hypothetical protein